MRITISRYLRGYVVKLTTTDGAVVDYKQAPALVAAKGIASHWANSLGITDHPRLDLA
jgi:hypothetical protein